MPRYDAVTPEAVQLRDQGFCVFPNVLDAAMVAELATVTEGLLAGETAEDRRLFRYQGSNITLAYQHPVFARLVAQPAALAALRSLGFPHPVWRSAHLLSKAPGAPPLYWHQDWWGWDDPDSAGELPPQIFVMYYLTDTRRENGCLRVIPGSHRRRLPLHDHLPAAHTDETYLAEESGPLFDLHPEEIDVPVRAGDAVVGDARVLHAAHRNGSEFRRSCLTLWYVPEFGALSEPLQAASSRRQPLEPPHWWEGDAGRAVEPLIAWYEGNAEPTRWNRDPGEHLR
jgi:ectoine hydroxylase-related dioxygenase (phytanoyl-CoA dioxygenase family)